MFKYENKPSEKCPFKVQKAVYRLQFTKIQYRLKIPAEINLVCLRKDCYEYDRKELNVSVNEFIDRYFVRKVLTYQLQSLMKDLVLFL